MPGIELKLVACLCLNLYAISLAPELYLYSLLSRKVEDIYYIAFVWGPQLAAVLGGYFLVGGLFLVVLRKPYSTRDKVWASCMQSITSVG